MSQIEELESRISAAMARISAGLGTLVDRAARAGQQAEPEAVEAPAAEAATEADAALPAATELMEALAEEQLVNAQLEERLKRLKDRHEEEMSDLQAQLAAARAEADAATQAAAEFADAAAQPVGPSAEEEALRAEVSVLRARLDELPDLDALSTELETLKAELAQAEDSEALRAELDLARAKLTEAEAEAEVLRAEFAEYEAQLADGDAADEELNALRKEVAHLSAQLDSPVDVEELLAEREALKEELSLQAEMTGRLDVDLQRLRVSNEQLRAAVTDLREANEANVGEPALINRAMLAELEGLRATRAADAAEAGAILSRLEPLLARAVNLPEGEDE